MESPFRCLDEFDVFMVSCTSSLFGGDPDFKIYFYVDENDDGYNFFQSMSISLYSAIFLICVIWRGKFSGLINDSYFQNSIAYHVPTH